MKNNNLELFKKGNYQPISNNFITEGMEALKEVDKIQEKYDKPDTDTFFNELRDQITGYCLGFDLVNTEKHGFDCKKNKHEDIFLEVKSASFSSGSWAGTFNDTTLEKAEAFKDKKLYTALSIWKNASDLLFICFGQSEEVGNYLEKKVKECQEARRRSTQTISMSKFLEYGFKICPIGRELKELKQILSLKSRSFINLSDDVFVDKKDIGKYIK